jgi:hypothetical protein
MNPDELAPCPVYRVFNEIGMRHYTRTASVAVMHAYRCPRCQRDGLAKFYCGRSDYAWRRSTRLGTGPRDPRQA